MRTLSSSVYFIKSYKIVDIKTFYTRGRENEREREREGAGEREEEGEGERWGKRRICLFDLILNVPSTIFQLYRDGSSWVEPVLS